MFARHVLFHFYILYHFLNAHTRKDDTNASDEYLLLLGTIYFGFHYSHHLLSLPEACSMCCI